METVDTHDMRSRTVGGLLAFADYLGEKGYQGKGAVQAWKTAVTKVFETTGGDDWQSVALDGIDLDDLVRRFHALTGNTYKTESVAVYKRRINNVMNAQAYFIENDQPPSFKKQPARKKPDSQPAGATEPIKTAAPEPANVSKLPAPAGDFFEFNYPLSPGRMVYMQLPIQMTKREIDRLCAVIQTLEEQRQLPPGEEQAA
jgi:hypothetical protein